MTTNREKILALMSELGIEPKKSLGQNFLVSDHVINKIIEAAKLQSAASIIEIGPGLGALTRELKHLTKSIQLIELDHIFTEYWRSEGLTVNEADALQWNWQQHNLPHPTLLVSNLPYQISSSLVVDRSLDDSVDCMILMFQKEVAQRIKAQYNTENYGMLSVVAQAFWKIDFLLEASSGDFLPPPKVASRVLVFNKIKSPVSESKQFLRFIKACFLHPRKIMVSNLIEGLGLVKEDILNAYNKFNFNDKIRAQELSVKQFLELYFALGYK